jgi:hypothetical protein
MSEFTGARRVREGEVTRTLTMGERRAFAMGATTKGVTVVLTDSGYRALAVRHWATHCPQARDGDVMHAPVGTETCSTCPPR